MAAPRNQPDRSSQVPGAAPAAPGTRSGSATEYPTVPAGAALLSYEERGSGDPLVLLHAGVADRRMWEQQVPAFTARYRVVTYDLRGYGDSTLLDEPFAPHEDLRAVLDGLGIERAHVLGVSMGGTVALDFALAYPERLASLIVCGATPGGTSASADIRAGWEAVDALLERGKVAEAIELELRMWVDGPFRTPGKVDAGVRERVREMEALAFARAMTEPEPEVLRLHPPATGRLGEIAVPTLILVGDLDYPQRVEVAATMSREIVGARLGVICGTAHVPNMEAPDEFNRLVLDFLGGVALTGERDLRIEIPG
jgi:3-oxoadipate enol-lactonase